MLRSGYATCSLRGPTSGRARSRTSVPRCPAGTPSKNRLLPSGAYSGNLLEPAFEIIPHQFRREHHFRIVFRRVLDLLEIVEAGILVDAVGAGDQPRRPCRIAVEMLMDGARRDIDDVARFPFVALDLVLRLPFVGVGDLDVAVLVQVVAETLHHIEAFLGEMPVLSGTAAGR